MTIRAELKRIHSPDIYDLESFNPGTGEAFRILVQAMFGPKNEEGEESFDIILCSPEWLRNHVSAYDFHSGKHHLICSGFKFDVFKAYLDDYAKNISGDTWEAVALKLAQLGKWEFEEYS